MASTIINKEVDISLLQSEIKSIYPEFGGISKKGNAYTFHGIQSINDIQTIIDDHVPLYKELAISKYLINNNKSIFEIDHNTDLTISLEVTEEFSNISIERGLLKKKTYTHSGETIFTIDYDYVFDAVLQVTEQRVVLTWFYEDGTPWENVKDKGYKKFSTKETRIATAKRRDAVVMQLEGNIINLLGQSATGETDFIEKVNEGAEFMAEMTFEIEQYKSSGITTQIIDKLDVLKNQYTFLQSNVAPNYTVIQYVTDFLNYK